MEEQIQMSVDKEAEITGQNNVLSQQVENKNLEISRSVSQDLNDVLLEIAQKQQQKKFPAAEYPENGRRNPPSESGEEADFGGQCK